ncbi:MAG: PSD1 and planctomycete cytochrome C domain-containing protein [Planctomycetaceae bacterium]
MLAVIATHPRSMPSLRMLAGTISLLFSFQMTGFGADDPAKPTTGATALSDDELRFFSEQVQPILAANCFRCHGETEFKGELSLTSRASVLKGGESGPAVDLDHPRESLLVEAINYESFEMPPTGKLAPRDVATLTDWVKRGLPMPARVETQAEGHHPPEINDETRAFWSFQTVHRPKVPTPQTRDWGRNPIDAFVLAGLEQAELQPNPPASPAELYRRLHYDLLGLPPDPEKLQTFVTDYLAAPEPTWRRTIDELLDSPHYGEQWARHWLDVVRYAETNSFERDNPKPFVWRYRDYVIRALNSDKPYDQFIREQLAGDELDQVTPESLIATGYYRLGLWDDEPADPLLAYYDGLDDIVGTTSQAFLGLTMNCARCHQHKLDPIPHEDYYRLLAYFRNVRHYGQRSDASVMEASVRNIATAEQEQALAAEKAAWEAKVHQLRTELDQLEEQYRGHLKGGERDDFQDEAVRQRVLRGHVGDWLTQAEFSTYADRRKEWNRLRQNPPHSAEQALVVKENAGEPPVTHVLLRGNPLSEGDAVEPGIPQILGGQPPEIVRPASGESSGRRRALANWIASADNPLTARVAVNRIWHWHFGRGLVRSTNNFGLQGDRPTHPELLDWLAAEFTEQGWSIKQLHRLILTSNTYRMSTQGRPEAIAVDPVNNHLWRFDMRRLQAEEIRDSILAVNGTLNVDQLFGPSVYPPMPAEVLAGQSRPGQGWPTSTPEDAARRSLYIHVKRSLQLPILAAFDQADNDATCPERFVSTQPTQALGMLNSEFLNQESERLAHQAILVAGPDDIAGQVQEMLRRVTQRKPTEIEVDRGVQLIRALQQKFGLSLDHARQQFALVALNLNEFVYLD